MIRERRGRLMKTICRTWRLDGVAGSLDCRGCGLCRRSIPRMSVRGATQWRVSERGPGWAVSEQAQNRGGVPTPVRKLISHVPAPRRDHREDEPTTLLEQSLVDTRVVHADLVRHVSNVELDGAAAARL